MDERKATRMWLQRQFKTSGIQLGADALSLLVARVQEESCLDPEDYVHSLMEEIEAVHDGRFVSKALLESVMSAVEGRRAARDPVQVIDAFEVPHIAYDPIRKMFHASAPGERRHLLADAKAKLALYTARYHLVHQRLRRNPLFRPPAWGALAGAGGRPGPECELSELKALLGVTGETRYVCGFLTQPEEGRYALEDLSARLPIDISAAEQTHGLFTQNSIVVAEGELTASGVFRVAALGMPPLEPREASIQALQGLDFFGGQVPEPRDVLDWQTSHAEDRVVVLSDVWLDRPEALAKLQAIFAGYAALDRPPSLFVLLGSFQSYDANGQGTQFGRLREQFATLGRLINAQPALRQGSRFVLVPGPGDVGPASSLPRPGLPRSLAAELLAAVPGAVLASNPCRIRHGDSQLVLFRDNLQHKMRGLAILPPAEAPEGEPEPPLFEHVCASVLQQSHLCPVPLEYQPIYWEADHALYLYPAPDALVLADAAPAAQHIFDSCSCLNPGSLADGTFGAWNPVTNEMELCDVAAGAETASQLAWAEVAEGEASEELDPAGFEEEEAAGEGGAGEGVEMELEDGEGGRQLGAVADLLA